MSDKLPQSQNPEEVDLGQIFAYIEKAFKGLLNFFKSIFKLLIVIAKKIAIFFLLCLNIFIKNIVIILLAGVLGYGVLFMLDKNAEPKYQSSLILNQNYNSGKVLYSLIKRYSKLAKDKDSISLGALLNISPAKAATLLEFEIVDGSNKNVLRNQYYDYIKNIDTVDISFKEFSEEYDIKNIKNQTINVYASNPSAFEELTEKLVNSLENNEFFNLEKEKTITKIKDKISVHQKMLVESDSLQKEYLSLLKSYYNINKESEKSESSFNLFLESNKNKIDTKEFQLFEQKKTINMAIVDLKEELKDKQSIFSIETGFKKPVKVANIYGKNKTIAAMFLFVLTFIVLLIKNLNLIKLLKNYGSLEQLTKP